MNDNADHERRPAGRGAMLEINSLAEAKTALGARALIEHLSVDRGLGPNHIAALCSISVSEIRGLRYNPDDTRCAATSDQTRSLARLAAFLDLVEEARPDDHPAGWMHTRFKETHTMSPATLYDDGHAAALLEHARGEMHLGELLERWDPDWSVERRSHWKVVDEPDGNRYLVRRT